jgi:hypothetical protein
MPGAEGRELNEQWVLEKAAEHFNKVRLEAMAHLGPERPWRATTSSEPRPSRHAQAQPVCLLPGTRGSDPMSDQAIDRDGHGGDWRARTSPMVRVPRRRWASSSRSTSSATPSSAFAGPEKMGKSYWLQDECTWLALNQRRKVHKLRTLGRHLAPIRRFIRHLFPHDPEAASKPRRSKPGKLRIPKRDQDHGQGRGRQHPSQT